MAPCSGSERIRFGFLLSKLFWFPNQDLFSKWCFSNLGTNFKSLPRFVCFPDLVFSKAGIKYNFFSSSSSFNNSCVLFEHHGRKCNLGYNSIRWKCDREMCKQFLWKSAKVMFTARCTRSLGFDCESLPRYFQIHKGIFIFTVKCDDL